MVGVQEGVITPSAGQTARFLRSELAFLEAQERNLAVRKAEIISFLRTLGVGIASSSADIQVPVDQAVPVEDDGVPPSVPAPAAGVDVEEGVVNIVILVSAYVFLLDSLDFCFIASTFDLVVC